MKKSTHISKIAILIAALTVSSIAFTACSSDEPTPTATNVPATATSAPVPTSTRVPAVTTTTTPATATPTRAPSTATPVPTIVSTAPCPTKGVTEMTGAGATFPFPLYSKMLNEYNKLCSVKVNYQSIGSGGGIAQVQAQTVDFGGSDAIMSATQKTQAKGGAVLHIPLVAGAEAIIFNLPGIERSQMKMTSEILANIYLKNIKKWNDPAIIALNPGLTLPNTDIAVVHRSDGSGTTFIFTSYLSQVSTEWKDKVGAATSVRWPGDIGGQGNEGVANQVKQIPGAIGYVELAYAKQNNLKWTQLQNKSGKFLDPSIEGAAAAADVASLPDNMEVVITNSDNPNAYPISGFTWLLIYENQTHEAKADAVARMAWWMLHSGQQYATPLDYAPLQGAAIAKAEALLKRITINGQPVLK
ncbi:MAG: phosphate ABC transporter substrate-binding protein PstS [Dehalococcoidia bacterium]|nr:phosphate ABC transporter substrate-binding protein PstS [Dehalococcoidia bacterium]